MTESFSRENPVRWSVEKRLEFIEFRLFWEGRINRKDLIEHFAISTPQASADIGLYKELAANNLVYDPREKCYLASETFRPTVLKPDAQSYLSQLRLISEGVLPKTASWLGTVPQNDAVPKFARSIDPEKLRCVVDCLRQGKAVYIHYQSMSRPDPVWRWIIPQALAYDGYRWHVRAWCQLRNQFQDFVFARILDVGEVKPSEPLPVEDVEWHEQVTLRIGPHPGLNSGARRAVELDYSMENGELRIETRVALSFYIERQLGIDLDAQAERQQIVLLNREEIEATKQATRARVHAVRHHSQDQDNVAATKEDQ